MAGTDTSDALGEPYVAPAGMDPAGTDPADDAAPVPGLGIMTGSWVATGAFAAAATVAATFPDRAARPVAVLDIVLFLIGTGAFLLAYARAIGRSRTEQVEIVGVFLLGAGAAPRRVRRSLLGALALQVVVALVTSSIRPYTSVAFGILVPMLGLGLAGLWGATHGRFPPRRQQ